MKDPMLEITGASVKVMRSHDYCHFEVCLSTAADTNVYPTTGISAALVDDLRKCAARLADKAVEQYKVAKEHAAHRESYEIIQYKNECRRIEAKPEGERTPEEQATLKARKDALWRANREYDYQDEWQDDE